MSEQSQRQSRSPLLSDRGATTIKDGLVKRLAGMAAGEVEGVHMGGGASRAAGGVLESMTGSQSQTRGVSVEVGQAETAIDLNMSIEYGKNILQTTRRVRERITERIESLTGLRVTELNVTINDVISPERDEEGREEGRRRELRSGPFAEDQTTALRAEDVRSESGRSEDDTQYSAATRRGRYSGDREETTLEEDETRELNLGKEEDRGSSRGGEGGTGDGGDRGR
ncbi:hypothetical protein BH24ACT19_BH24ACT19_12730 [soil metagenome]